MTSCPWEEAAAATLLCLCPVHKGSWQSESDYRDQESETGEMLASGFVWLHNSVSDKGTHHTRRLIHPQDGPSISNVSSLQLAWKLSLLGGLWHLYALRNKGYTPQIFSLSRQRRGGVAGMVMHSQGTGSYQLTYVLELMHSELRDPTQLHSHLSI